MKKRIISLLLTVLMVLSLFSGLTVNAYAATTAYGANTIEYTMGQGDYVLRICQKLGLNYYTCKDAIQILNNIYDGQWNKLAVGRVLTLPASDADAVLIANGARQTVANTGAAATTLSTAPIITGTATTGTYSTANTATFNAGAASADTLNYYLVPYTMSYGETVSGVCNNLGVNFSIFSPFIKQVNNISNWNKVRAGDTILVPTPVCPSVGTTCYGVMQHIVQSSDTAYGIVSNKGISYNANERLLKVLNQTDNLAALKAGGNFFYPVPLTVSVPGTGNPGSTATTTTTTTVTDGNGTTTTQTTTTAKLYKLTSGMAASDGTMIFYVNNNAVTAAPAGAKVTVLTSANSGKAVQSLVVKNSDGTADIHMTGDTFIMPGCDVRVDATIKGGHDINISANYSGKASASVNGISVQAAVKGAAVVIKSADPNYEISAVYASYKKLVSTSTKTALTVSSSNAFIMPDADVDVEVILKPVSTYAFYVNDPANGSFYLQVNGSSVTRAAKGATVTVVAKPDSGYEAVSLKVSKHGDTSKIVNVFSNTFTMPAFDVDVEVEFAGKGNNILIMPSQIATVLAFDQAAYSAMGKATLEESITEANSNEKVYLVAGELKDNGDLVDFDETKYSIKYEIKRNSDGLMVKTSPASGPLKNAYVFTMPKGGVTVTPIITLKRDVTVSGEIYRTDANGSTVKADGKYLDCSFSVTYQNAGNEKRVEFNGTKAVSATISALEYVDLRYDNADGVAFIKYKVEVTGAEEGTDAEVSELLTNEANLHGYFQIPLAKSVVIKAYFETGMIGIGQAAITGVGSVGYEIEGINPGPVSSATCAPGDKVRITLTPGNGYKFDDNNWKNKLIVSRKDNGAPLTLTQETWSGKTVYSFIMPAEGVDVQATFDAKPFTITMFCQDETGTPITGQGIWQIAINWVIGAVDLNPAGTKVEVAYEDYITVAMTEAGWSKYDMVSFRIDDKEYTADELNFFYNFQMIEDRAKDLTITAILRPRVPFSVAIHNLTAIYDQSRGGVQFMILESATGYSKDYLSKVDSTGKLVSSQYVNRAVTGDKVAIAASIYDGKYTIKKDDIVINSFGGDETRTIVNEEYYTVDGKNVKFFTFTMPDSDVIVSIPFNGTKYNMKVVVTDADGKPVSGMVNLTAGVQTYNDVAADNSFGQIEYNTLVTILRSMLCIRENMVITKVDVKTDPGKTPVYYYNYSANSGGNGPSFNMPASDVTVYITIDDFIPNAYSTFQRQLVGGTLQFRSGPSFAAPLVAESDIDVGDEVYVLEIPDAGNAHLGKGDLRITNNGLVYTMANWVNELPDGTNVWKLKVPAGVTIFTAVWDEEGSDVDTDHGVYAYNTVGGTLSFFKEDGTTPTLKFEEGKKLYIKAVAKDGYENPKSKDDISAYDENGFKLDVEEDSKGYYIDGSKLKADTGSVYVSVDFKAGEKKVTFEIKPADKTVMLVLSDGRTAEFSGTKTYELPVGMKVTAVSTTDGYEDVVLTADEGTISGSVYTVPNKDAKVTITLKEAANPIKWSATNGSLSITKDGINVSSAAVGDTIKIAAKPDTGYNALKRTNLTVTKISDGSVVEVKGDGSTTDPWNFAMPAGGVNISAVFESSDTIKVTFKGLASGLKAKLAMSAGSNVLEDKDKTFYFAPGTVVTISSDTEGYDDIAIVANKGTVSGNKFTVPSEGDVEVTITMKAAANPIKWTTLGGSLDFTDVGTSKPNIVSADVGAKIKINATPDTENGYEALKRENLAVIKLSDNSFVEVKGDGSNTNPWNFVMPAGGVNVVAVFESSNSATVNFKAEGAAAKLTMSLGSAEVPDDGNSHEWKFPAGTVITVASAEEGYDKIEIIVTSGNAVVSNNTVTVKGNAEVTIKLSSSKNLITPKNSSTANLQFFSDLEMKNPIGSANEKDPVYVKAEPQVGYGKDALNYPTNKKKISDTDLAKWREIIKITSKVDGKPVELKATEEGELTKEGMAHLYFVMPAGGVNVTAEYEPVQVKITIKNASTTIPSVYVTVNGGTVTVYDDQYVVAEFGSTVTVTSTDSSYTASISAKNAPAQASKGTYNVTDGKMLKGKGYEEILTVTFTKNSTTSSYSWIFGADGEEAAGTETAENYEAPAETAANTTTVTTESGETIEYPLSTSASEETVESAEAYEAPVESAETAETTEAAETAEAAAEAESNSTEAQGEQPEA